jgi:hypothetical protein
MRYLIALLSVLTAITPLAAQLAVPLSLLNSACEEREPTPSADGQTLYFWRKDCGGNTGGLTDPGDIWSAARLGSGWTQPRKAAAPLNSYGQDFVLQTSRRGDTLWMCQISPGTRQHGMSYAVRNGNGWGRVTPVSIRGLEVAGSFKDFYIGPGRRLFLVNEGNDALGGSDLYLCLPINDTAWSRPIHLGPLLNTAGDEDAPFLSPDGKTLYFSSNGHLGKGGHDVFFSKRLDATWLNWSAPEPVGPPINTPANDFDFFIAADGRTAYWAVETGPVARSELMEMRLDACEADIYPLEDKTACNGEWVELEAGFSPAEDLTWQWFKDGVAIPGANTRKIRVGETGAYTVERRAPGCVKISLPRRITFVEPPAVSVETLSPYLCPNGGEVTLRSSALSPQYAYRWLKNSLPISSSGRSFLVVNTPGRYAVEVIQGGCVALSNTLEVMPLAAPIVAVTADTASGNALLRPDWRWTNKIPKDNLERRLMSVAAAPDGRTFVVAAVERKKQVEEEILIFGSEGLIRTRVAGERFGAYPATLSASDDQGNLILARTSPLLSKYNKNGGLIWRKEESSQSVLGLATDPVGNIFVAGELSDTMILSGQMLQTPRRGGLYLAKYDPDGNLIWARSFAVDFRKETTGNLLASDAEGSVYLTAGFELVATLLPFQLKGGLTGLSYFLAKFSPSGETLWAHVIQQPGRARQRTIDLAVDETGKALALINRQITVFDSKGAKLWQSRMEGPDEAVQHRAAAFEGEFYLTGVTAKGEIFVSVLNKMFRQTVLWQGKGADPEQAGAALIAAGARHMAFVGEAPGHDFPGDQFDLTSNARFFVAKFGFPILAATRQPAIMCGGKPVYLLTPAQRGIQWYRDGVAIPGASQSRFAARMPGNYSVRLVSGDCDLASNVVEVKTCEEAQLPPAPSAPKPEPVVVRPPETTRPEPVVVKNTMPRKIRGRSVKPQKTVTLTGREVVISIWDRGAVDLDTVSVNLNGQWLVEEYCLQKNKYEIRATLSPGDNYLVLYAHNLGQVAPNTASLVVTDGRKSYSLDLKSTLKSSGALRLRVE